jgi:hypothetical protein|tara:strand:- start:99 stop:227 length:129 start_codon:yes stop_codon:yes gene_type:complete
MEITLAIDVLSNQQVDRSPSSESFLVDRYKREENEDVEEHKL